MRSARMKLPTSVGMKKSKAIETMCNELGLETTPPCTEEILTEFNELRYWKSFILDFQGKNRRVFEEIMMI